MKKRNFFSAVAVLTAISLSTVVPIEAMAESTVKINEEAKNERSFDSIDGEIKISGDTNVSVSGKIESNQETGLSVGDYKKRDEATGKDKFVSSADATVKVGNGVSVSNEGENSGTYIKGVNADTNNGKINIKIDGDVNASTNQFADGIHATAKGSDSKIDITVNGNVSAKSKLDKEVTTRQATNGVIAKESDGKINITINGDIFSGAETGRSAGIYTIGNSMASDSKRLGDINIKVNGDIKAGNDSSIDKYGDGIISQDNDGNVTITVDGNISSKSASGIDVIENDGTITIISTGTVSGKDAAVTVRGSDNAAVYDDDGEIIATKKAYTEPSVTVWKLASDSGDLVKAEKTTYTYEKDEEGNLNETGTKVEEDKAMADKVLSSINYIIKASAMEDGKETSNGKIVLKGASGSVSVNGKTYDTAHQDETLTINVTTVSGYKYSLRNGEALLTANADGSYTLKVPAGGGIDLQAVIEKIQTNNNNTNTSTKNNTTTKISSGSSSRNRSSRSSSGGGSGSYVQVGASGIPDTMIGKNTSSTPGSWSKDINGNWIYNNTTGNAYKSTWITTKNQWYFLNSNGNPLTGWQYINGAWYYLSTVDTAEHPYGSMYVSGKTPDGYTIGTDGKIKR